MKINNINVIGIKDTVSRLRNTPADRWAVTLDDNPTMADVKDKVREVMDIRAKSRDDFARGCHHVGFASAEEEGWQAFFSAELVAAGF